LVGRVPQAQIIRARLGQAIPGQPTDPRHPLRLAAQTAGSSRTTLRSIWSAA
jgi:hypothetical protein